MRTRKNKRFQTKPKTSAFKRDKHENKWNECVRSFAFHFSIKTTSKMQHNGWNCMHLAQQQKKTGHDFVINSLTAFVLACIQ